EKAAFLAADISSFAGDTQAGATLNCLSTALDDSLDLFFDMLRSPGFQQSRIDVAKGNMLEEMKQRNDDAGTIIGREWRWLLYGDTDFTTRHSTGKTLDAITRQDMVDFHKAYWRPENMILAIGGDVDPKAIIAKLDQSFAGCEAQGPA